MVFVADDLAAWLIGRLADAGLKKLTTLVLGTEQQRALRQAAAAAIERAAEQLAPSDREQAEHLPAEFGTLRRDCCGTIAGTSHLSNCPEWKPS